MKLGRGHDGDSGFTLIELVISVLILGVIIAPLASAFTLNFQTSSEAKQRISNSADAQLLTSYFSDDVASSEKVDTSPTGCAGGSPFVELPRANGVLVDYIVTQNAEAEAELNFTPIYQVTRVTCGSAGGSPTTTLTLSTSLRSQPTLKCDSVSCPNGSSKPLIVTLDVDDVGRPVTDTAQDYVFTVTGTRRVTQ